MKSAKCITYNITYTWGHLPTSYNQDNHSKPKPKCMWKLPLKVEQVQNTSVIVTNGLADSLTTNI